MASIQKRYDNRTLSYFYQTVYGEEDGRLPLFLSKWEKPIIFIKIKGKPTPTDLSFLRKSISDVNKLLKFNKVVLTSNEAIESDIDMLFINFDQLMEIDWGVKEDDRFVGGMFWLKRNKWTNAITKATIFIDINHVHPVRRKHTILEEFVQSLGPTQDNFTYENSVFYEGYSIDTVLSPIDQKVIELLYNESIPSGLHKTYFKNTLLIKK